MPKFKVITPVDFNNKRYEPGRYVELEQEDADPLLLVGAVAPTGKGAATDDKAAGE
jgi:hypothetical protein